MLADRNLNQQYRQSARSGVRASGHSGRMMRAGTDERGDRVVITQGASNLAADAPPTLQKACHQGGT